MTFDEAMQRFPGVYTEADRGQFEAATAQTEKQNALANQQAAAGNVLPSNLQSAQSFLNQANTTAQPTPVGVVTQPPQVQGSQTVPTQSDTAVALPSTSYGSSGVINPAGVSTNQVGATVNPTQPAAPSLSNGVDFNSLVSQNQPAGLTPPAVGTTTPTTATQPATSAVAAGFNPTSYGQQHPDLIRNFNADPGYASMYGSLEGYLAADAQVNGTPADKSGAASYIQQQQTTGQANTQLGPAQAAPVNAAGNFNQASTGAQAGNYASSGTNSSVQNGQQQQNVTDLTHQVGATQNDQSSSGLQSTTGTTGQTTAGTTGQTQSNTGTTAGQTNVTSPFDFQSLITPELNRTAQTDASRSAFLDDFMKTGGTQFGSQVDQAVRNSLTGPQMTGAGDSARARAAGYAGAQVARNNADQRLAASQQLGGQTGLGSAVQQTAPLFGTSTTGTSTGTGSTVGSNQQATTGTSSGTTATSGAQSNTGTSDLSTLAQKASNTLDFQSLVGNETNAGSATGTSASNAGGQIPSSTPVQTGGCVVCSAYASMGLMHPGAIRRAVRFKIATPKYHTAGYGYMSFGPSIARLVLRHGDFAKVFKPIARAILYHEVRLSAPTRLRWRLLPFITHEAFDRLSYLVGLFVRHRGVQCPTVKQMLIDNNLNFILPCGQH